MSMQNKCLFRMVIAVFVTALLVLSLSGALLAADFRSGETITIAAEQVIDDDLVLTGNTILVNGTINGDLIAIGGDVTVNGVVKGSLLSAGRSLVVNGTVEGSLYFGGATLTLGSQAKVVRNLFFGGYNLSAERGSIVMRDGLMGAYQASLNGEIQRDIRANLAALQLNGKVGGDVNATVGSPEEEPMPPFFLSFAGQNLPAPLNPGIRIGSDAQIVGTLNYASPAEQRSTILAEPSEGVAFTPVTVTATDTAIDGAAPVAPTTQAIVLSWLWVRLRELVSLLVLGALALWLIPKWFHRATENAWHEPVAATGWGFVVTVTGYMLALIAFILLIVVTAGLGRLTLGGLASSFFFSGFTGISAAFTLFTLMVAYGSKLVVAYPVGHWLMAKLSTTQAEKRAWPLVVGAVLYVLAVSIPYLGFVVSFFVTMIGVGAMWLIFRNRPKAASVTPKMVLMPT